AHRLEAGATQLETTELRRKTDRAETRGQTSNIKTYFETVIGIYLWTSGGYSNIKL
ncbi:hypothetical protein CU098_006590, partial [Rhizopus stolonifer]